MAAPGPRLLLLLLLGACVCWPLVAGATRGGQPAVSIANVNPALRSNAVAAAGPITVRGARVCVARYVTAAAAAAPAPCAKRCACCRPRRWATVGGLL